MNYLQKVYKAEQLIESIDRQIDDVSSPLKTYVDVFYPTHRKDRLTFLEAAKQRVTKYRNSQADKFYLYDLFKRYMQIDSVEVDLTDPNDPTEREYVKDFGFFELQINYYFEVGSTDQDIETGQTCYFDIKAVITEAYIVSESEEIKLTQDDIDLIDLDIC
jgi:hypothetical protein